MWRRVSVLKRQFVDMANSVRRDVDVVRADFNSSVSQINADLRDHLFTCAVGNNVRIGYISVNHLVVIGTLVNIKPPDYLLPLDVAVAF